MIDQNLDSLSNVVGGVNVLTETSSVWGMSYELASIVIPTVTTLIVCGIGLLVNHVVLLREKNKYRKVLYTWCDLIYKNILEEIEIIRKTALDIKNNKQTRWIVYANKSCYAKKINDLSAERIMSVLALDSKAKRGKTADEKEKCAYGIVCNIDYLSHAEDKLFSIHEEYCNEIKRINSQCESIIKNIDESIKRLKSRREPEIKRFCFEVGRLVVGFNKAQDDVELIQNNFITPLFSLANNYLKTNNDTCNDIANIMDSSYQMTSLYNYRIKVNEQASQNLELIASLVEQSSEDLVKCVSYLRSYTKIRFWS